MAALARNALVLIDGEEPASTGPDRFADVAEAKESYRRVREERDALEAQIRADRLQLSRAAAKEADDHLNGAAIALLSGAPVSVASASLTERIRVSEERLAVVARAEQIARGMLRELREERSSQLCAAAVPEHRKLVRRIARALADLAAASNAERAFRDGLASRGVLLNDCILPSMAFPDRLAGDPERLGTPANAWLRTARLAGHVGERESPALIVPKG